MSNSNFYTKRRQGSHNVFKAKYRFVYYLSLIKNKIPERKKYKYENIVLGKEDDI